MMLTEETPVLVAALPLAELKDHLRLGSGFTDDGLQDGLIESYLRAALAAIEGRIGKVLFRRRFHWVLECWRDQDEQALPVAPVAGVLSLTLVDADGTEALVPDTTYRLIPDLHRPRIGSKSATLPSIPTNGLVKVVFDAGFGPGWTDVPVDLRQAVLLLASEYYEHRHEGGEQSAGLPFGVVTLIERWRTVRILGGGRK
ncbi:head-tail connector protein [Tabrizicola sp.]|uniref:head-tail connector protein n=1 Tax=Tabrizicola sp. TaxID=2005166 RepID=UPI002626CF2C|nr:head-tail connector protein [Tabrizicola sp.]MDM7931179.1 head-tail connector protein [Tabrizicola sp.]